MSNGHTKAMGDEIQAQIDNLKAKMAGATGDDKAKYQAQIDKLKDRKNKLVDEAQGKVEDVTNAVKDKL